MKSLFIILAFISISPMAFSNEITKGNREVVSIDGKTYDLDQMLEDDKGILLFFSATWCSASWEVVERGVLDSIYLAFGSPGSNSLELLFIEADPRTSVEHLQGNVSDTDTIGTLGNWVTDHQYPIFNEESLALEYTISAFPTIILLKKNHDPVTILGGSNLTVESIGSWLEEPMNRGFAGHISDVKDELLSNEEKAYINIINALKERYQSTYNYQSWKYSKQGNVESEEGIIESYIECEEVGCHQVKIETIETGHELVELSFSKRLEVEGKEVLVTNRYVVYKEGCQISPEFGVVVESKFISDGTQFDHPIKIGTKGRCNAYLPMKESLEEAIENGKAKYYNQPTLDALNICSSEPYWSALP